MMSAYPPTGLSLEAFSYVCPETIEEAVTAMQGDRTLALAGGTDLLPQLREGRRSAARIVDLKRIAELVEIRPRSNGGLYIGAAASATRLAHDSAVTERYPALAAAARLIGGRQIQNRASLGGNVCNAAPSADGVPVLICLAAQAQIAGPGGRRESPVEDLFVGPGRSTLSRGEILTAIVVPPQPERSAAAYLRFTPRREMDIAIAGVGAWVALDADGRIAGARIALASVAPTPIRSPAAERIMTGEAPGRDVLEAAGRAASGDASPISDTRGSVGYRRELVRVLTARVLATCCSALGAQVEVS